MKIYLVTGGAGFIGSNFVKYMLKKYQNIKIIVLDKLTYAGNLVTIKEELDDERVEFVKGDICNKELVEKIFSRFDIDVVVNFAAESHVDRSIEEPEIFLKTNILGVQNLLDVSKKYWSTEEKKDGYPVYRRGKKFLQVSTDEVYGSLKKDRADGHQLKFDNQNLNKLLENRDDPKSYGTSFFTENSKLDPKSPYSVSKASADMLAMAYLETYHMPVNITRCSNNYGPYHFPEKLIPLIINNILHGKKLPLYGDGKNVRDWLFVEDHCKGIDAAIEKGVLGEVYNIGGFNEKQNIDIIKLIIDIISLIMEETPNYQKILKTNIENINYDLISFVTDRLGHDARYAIDPTKIVTSLDWYPETTFEKGIKKTILWYLDNQDWVEEIVKE